MPLTVALRPRPGKPFPLALHCRNKNPPLPLKGAITAPGGKEAFSFILLLIRAWGKQMSPQIQRHFNPTPGRPANRSFLLAGLVLFFRFSLLVVWPSVSFGRSPPFYPPPPLPRLLKVLLLPTRLPPRGLPFFSLTIFF